MGRFINADALVSTGQGVLGNNMFAYCRNNPVCRIDASGYGDVDFKETNADEADVAPEEHEIGGGWGFDPYQAGLDRSGVTNPYGRHGGPSHTGLVKSLRLLFEALGWDVSPNEKRVLIPDEGRYRYPDLTVNTGMETIYVQVGRSTNAGNPIAREQRAIDDLGKTGNQVWFFCYDD